MLPGLRSLAWLTQAGGPKWNPADKAASVTLSADNLRMTVSGAVGGVRNDLAMALTSSTPPVYVEARVVSLSNSLQFGPANASQSLTSAMSAGTNAAAYNLVGGTISHNLSTVASGKPTFAAGDVVGMLVSRPGTGTTAQWFKNGVACDIARNFTGLTGDMFFEAYNAGTTGTSSLEILPQPAYPLPTGAQYWGAK